MHQFDLAAVGKDGLERHFNAELETERGAFGDWLKYTIRSTSRPGHFFQARFKAMKDGRIRPAALDHDRIPEFVAKGIPEAIFADVARRSGRTLVSSRTRDDGEPVAGEDDYDNVDRRSPDADKLWKRLVETAQAKYDACEDRYTFIPRT